MKIVLVLVAVLIGIWLFRSGRRRDNAAGNKADVQPDKAPVEALDMVRCQHCDLHLPMSDAVTGKNGVYCSVEHRRRAEP